MDLESSIRHGTCWWWTNTLRSWVRRMDECGVAGPGLHLQVGHLKFELEKNCDTLWEECNFIMNST